VLVTRSLPFRNDGFLAHGLSDINFLMDIIISEVKNLKLLVEGHEITQTPIKSLSIFNKNKMTLYHFMSETRAYLGAVIVLSIITVFLIFRIIFITPVQPKIYGEFGWNVPSQA